MKIFGLEIKRLGDEPPANPALVYRGSTFGYTSGMPTSNLELFYKYYKKSVDVRRCIVELQETVAVGGYEYVDQDGEPIEKEGLEFEDILQYGRGADAFIRRFIRDLSIGGNFYCLKLKNKADKLIGFQPLDPRYIGIKANQYGEVIGYIQRLHGKIREFTADEIVHFYDESDPDNEILGLSLMEGLIVDVLADTEAGLSNYYFFKNNAVPSQIIVLDDNMSDKEKKFAVEQFKNQFSGGKNAHKISAVTGVKDIKKLQESIKDMEFDTLRGFTTNKVCATFGVPKVILNYTDGVNYTNADMQYTKFIENTIRPRERRVANLLNLLLEHYMYDSREMPDMEIVIVDEHISDIEERTNTVTKQIATGVLTINEAREELGLEKFEIEEADKPLITRSLTLLEDAGLDNISISPFEK